MRVAIKSRTLFLLLVLLTVLTVVIHSSQYLPESFSLFITVAIARLSVALLVGVCAWITLFLYNKVFFPNRRAGSLLNLSAVCAAVVTMLMVLASYGNELPAALWNLYLAQP